MLKSTKNKWGFQKKRWNAAKAEVAAQLIEVARQRGRIAYSDLAAKVGAIQFAADDPRFWHLLGEISIDEDRAGRPLLSAVVVHKHGDMRPGLGFYELAKYLGRTVKEVDRFWLAEFNRVHDYWANQRDTKVLCKPRASKRRTRVR